MMSVARGRVRVSRPTSAEQLYELDLTHHYHLSELTYREYDREICRRNTQINRWGALETDHLIFWGAKPDY